MGVRAHLFEVPAGILSNWMIGNIDEKILASTPHTFLDKSWYVLHLMFRGMKPPLTRAISGEQAYPAGSSPTLDSFIEGIGAGYYIAFTSPHLVQEIAAALQTLSESEIVAAAHESAIAEDTYIKDHLEDLRQAYSRAAANGNGLCITIA